MRITAVSLVAFGGRESVAQRQVDEVGALLCKPSRDPCCLVKKDAVAVAFRRQPHTDHEE